MKPLVEYLVRELVDHPDSVEVTEQDGDPITLQVRVAPDDLGKIIGKHGRIANALRTVARACAQRDRRKVDVDIVS